MKPIPKGAQGQFVHRVESEHLANRFKDSILPPVFSTPYLILIMENAALNAIKQYLEAGESAVGTRIDVRHLVATPVGREVIGHAEVIPARFVELGVVPLDGTVHDRVHQARDAGPRGDARRAKR